MAICIRRRNFSFNGSETFLLRPPSVTSCVTYDMCESVKILRGNTKMLFRRNQVLSSETPTIKVTVSPSTKVTVGLPT